MAPYICKVKSIIQISITMIVAEIPFDEELRLLDLASYDLLDTAAEDDFDDLVELASQICKCPISLITLLDRDRQWFKAKKGLQDSGTPRNIAFCSHAILQDEIFIVENTKTDERFFDNPLVTGDLNIGFYAGAPIISPAGHKLGTICIIDDKPKKLNREEEAALMLLSNQVTKLLELRKKNKLIRQRAEEIVALKSRMVTNVMNDVEKDKKQIAFNLHEDLAQTVAASIIYLKMAEESDFKNPGYIQTVSNQLNDVLVKLKSISTTITPTIVSWIPVEELVQEFIEKIAVTFSFEIKVHVIGKENNINSGSDIAITCIRIIEQWLKVLSGRKGISLVNISIHAVDEIELHLEDNGPLLSFNELEKNVYESCIYDRTRTQGGTVDLSVSTEGKNLLTIVLPQENLVAA